MKGIILAAGEGLRLTPVTQYMNKHLLPVYNKPMIYYPLTTLMLAGIRDILIISQQDYLPAYQQLFNNGQQWNINISYAVQNQPKGIADALRIGKDFIYKDHVCLILGDNIFYGNGLSDLLQKIVQTKPKAHVFCHKVSNPQAYGIATIDEPTCTILSIEEKPLITESNYAITGIYFYDNQAIDYAHSLTPSNRNELEITDINKCYLKNNAITATILHRGYTWFDVGTFEGLLNASNFIHMMESRQSQQIGCPEEIAWRMGYIDTEQLQALIHQVKKNNPYGLYLTNLVKNECIFA